MWAQMCIAVAAEYREGTPGINSDRPSSCRLSPLHLQLSLSTLRSHHHLLLCSSAMIAPWHTELRTCLSCEQSDEKKGRHMCPILNGALTITHSEQEERTSIHGKPRAIAAITRRSQSAHEVEGKKARYVKKQKSTAAPSTPSRPRCLAASRSKSNTAY